MRKHVLGAVAAFFFFLGMPWSAVPIAHAVAGDFALTGSGAAGAFCTAGTLRQAGTTAAFRLTKIRGCTHPITISKIRSVTKIFGYLDRGNERGLFGVLTATSSISGRTPGDRHRPRPAGRSP